MHFKGEEFIANMTEIRRSKVALDNWNLTYLTLFSDIYLSESSFCGDDSPCAWGVCEALAESVSENLTNSLLKHAHDFVVELKLRNSLCCIVGSLYLSPHEVGNGSHNSTDETGNEAPCLISSAARNALDSFSWVINEISLRDNSNETGKL